MEYPVVAVDKTGHSYLLVSGVEAIHVDPEDGCIGYTTEIPTDLLFLKFPVKLYANHLAIGTTKHLHEPRVILGLQAYYENYLMPQYISKAQCKQLLASEASPVAVEKFFPFWAPPVQENQEMATKKPAAEKKAAAKKPAAEKKAAAKKPAAKPKVEKAAKEPKAKKPGIGAFCLDLIAKGKTNDEILEAIAKNFPDAKTSRGCVAFYRNKAKAAG